MQEGQMQYEAPEITDYGTLTDLTAGTQDGNLTDRDFPVNTPRDEITFSD
jgi:hypothetical protein